MNKQNKGITLVALVITIIVLIILAGVSINSVMNGGLIDNAKDAKNKYEEGKVEEGQEIDNLTAKVEDAAYQIVIKKQEQILTEYFQENEIDRIYKVGFLTNINPGTTVQEVLQDLPQDEEQYSIYDIEGVNPKNNADVLTTGMIIKQGTEKVGRIVIYGDVDCEGTIDTLDGSRIGKILTGTNNAQDFQKVAADVNNDGFITAADATMVFKSMSYDDVEIIQNIEANIPRIVYTDEAILEAFKNTDLYFQTKDHSKVFATGITPGTTISALYTRLNDDLNFEIIIDDEDDASSTTLVKTNSKIEDYSQNVYLNYLHLVIFGDINEDGAIDGNDLTQLKTYLTETDLKTATRVRESANLLACDINGDGDLTKADYDLLETHINGGTTSQITQNRKALLLEKDWSTWQKLEF